MRPSAGTALRHLAERRSVKFEIDAQRTEGRLRHGVMPDAVRCRQPVVPCEQESVLILRDRASARGHSALEMAVVLDAYLIEQASVYDRAVLRNDLEAR